MIDTALELDGAFTNCRLTRTVRVDEDNEVDLTGLSITRGGWLHRCHGRHRDEVRILLLGERHRRRQDQDASVNNGNLMSKREVDDPNVDVDIPWYC